MKRFWIVGLTVTMLLGVPIVLHAQWAIGGSVGVTDSDIDVAVYDPPNTTADDSSPFSWQLFVGYAFGENLGLEAGYVDLGSEYSLINALGYGEHITFESRAAFVTLLGHVRVHDRALLFARLGAAYWTTDIDLTEGTFRSSGSDSDVDAVLGFGFDADVYRRLVLRFEWEQFQNVGDDVSVARPESADSKIELGGHDVSRISLGLYWRF
jgi:hypothetical protein